MGSNYRRTPKFCVWFKSYIDFIAFFTQFLFLLHILFTKVDQIDQSQTDSVGKSLWK